MSIAVSVGFNSTFWWRSPLVSAVFCCSSDIFLRGCFTCFWRLTFSALFLWRLTEMDSSSIPLLLTNYCLWPKAKDLRITWVVVLVGFFFWSYALSSCTTILPPNFLKFHFFLFLLIFWCSVCVSIEIRHVFDSKVSFQPSCYVDKSFIMSCYWEHWKVNELPYW